MLNIPPLSSFLNTRLSQATTDLRNQVATTSEEAVTGRYSDVTKHLSGRIGDAMLGQKAVDDIARERTQLGTRSNRLDIVQNALATIQDNVGGIDTRMLAAVGTGDLAGQKAAAKDAARALESTLMALNARHGERYLFSGDATDRAAFAGSDQVLADVRQIADTATSEADFNTAIDAYFNDPAGPWQTQVYRGLPDASDPDAVTAIDPALTDIVSSLAVMAVSDPETGGAITAGNTSLMNGAASRLSAAQVSLTDLRADTGRIQEQIGNREDALNIEETLLTQAFNDMTGRDQYEAAAALRDLETNLEAGYLLTTRLSDLSLLNYLR